MVLYHSILYNNLTILFDLIKLHDNSDSRTYTKQSSW